MPAMRASRLPLWMKVILIIMVTLLLITAKLLSHLGQVEVDYLMDTETTEHHVDVDSLCASHIERLTLQYQSDIESLKDQIRELQDRLRDDRKDNTDFNVDPVNLHSNSLKHFDDQLARTDILAGRSYPTERHAPVFTHFTMWQLYTVHSGMTGKVVDKVNGLQRVVIDEVVDESVRYLNSSIWRRDHFTEGIYHSSPSIGSHYELYFVNDKNLKTRVTLFQPDSKLVPIKTDILQQTNDKLNIVVPLSGRLDTFQHFLSEFEPILVKLRYGIFLTIVYFGESVNDVMRHLQPFILKHKYRNYHVEHIQGRNFSRGYALDMGIKWWRARYDPLVFLCDVDVIFTEEFINRCKSYTQRKQRVYYPIVFSLYNPQMVENYLHQKLPTTSSKLRVASEFGMWRQFGYGMACMYRSDYLDSGGFDINLQEWGEEDALLYRKFAKSNITVIRSSDPNIFHMWHQKSCSTKLSDEHYNDCIKSKVLTEGSQNQYGHMIFHEKKT